MHAQLAELAAARDKQRLDCSGVKQVTCDFDHNSLLDIHQLFKRAERPRRKHFHLSGWTVKLIKTKLNKTGVTRLTVSAHHEYYQGKGTTEVQHESPPVFNLPAQLQ